MYLAAVPFAFAGSLFGLVWMFNTLTWWAAFGVGWLLLTAAIYIGFMAYRRKHNVFHD